MEWLYEASQEQYGIIFRLTSEGLSSEAQGRLLRPARPVWDRVELNVSGFLGIETLGFREPQGLWFSVAKSPEKIQRLLLAQHETNPNGRAPCVAASSSPEPETLNGIPHLQKYPQNPEKPWLVMSCAAKGIRRDRGPTGWMLRPQQFLQCRYCKIGDTSNLDCRAFGGSSIEDFRTQTDCPLERETGASFSYPETQDARTLSLLETWTKKSQPLKATHTGKHPCKNMVLRATSLSSLEV